MGLNSFFLLPGLVCASFSLVFGLLQGSNRETFFNNLYFDLTFSLYLTLRVLEGSRPISWDKYLLLMDGQTLESS